MRWTKITPPTVAIIPAATTAESVQPRVPASVSAHVAAPRLTTASPEPTTSGPRAACGSRDSGTDAKAHTTTRAATGTLMRNAQRHPGPSTNQPPRNGPIAPATPPSPDHAPTALARSRSRKLACRIARLPGVSNAAPMPWSTRAPMSTSTLGAAPHNSDAPANQIVPIRNTLRRPYRSPRAPPSRISDARARRYPVSTHCNELTLTSKSSPIWGRATLTMVASSIAIPLAATVAASATRPPVDRRVSPASSAGRSSTRIAPAQYGWRSEWRSHAYRVGPRTHRACLARGPVTRGSGATHPGRRSSCGGRSRRRRRCTPGPAPTGDGTLPRAWMLERCVSMTARPVPAMASRRAML